MSGLQSFLQWCQSFAFFPVIEARLLFSDVKACDVIAKMSQGVGLQLFMQQLTDDVTYLRNRETGGCFFPPVVSLA